MRMVALVPAYHEKGSTETKLKLKLKVKLHLKLQVLKKCVSRKQLQVSEWMRGHSNLLRFT